MASESFRQEEDAFHSQLACLATLESPIQPHGVPPVAINASSSTALDVVYVDAHRTGRTIGLLCRLEAPTASADRTWCEVIVMWNIWVS